MRLGEIRAQSVGLCPPGEETSRWHAAADGGAAAAAEEACLWLLIDGTFAHDGAQDGPLAGFRATRWVSAAQLLRRLDARELEEALAEYGSRVDAAARRALAVGAARR